MSHLKTVGFFLLKSICFSIIFIFTAFILYSFSYRQPKSVDTNAAALEEYSRQLTESSKTLEIQKDLLRRSEANMTAQEQNIKRMSAILDLWENQAKKGE